MSMIQQTQMLVGEGAKLDVHGCKTVDMASSFGKALLEFIFIVMAAIALLIGVNAGKSKVGRESPFRRDPWRGAGGVHAHSHAA